jgi:tRNA (mo5U34)-methyltransferase
MKRKAVEFAARLDDVKARAEAPDWGWYPFKMLPAFIDQLDVLLSADHRHLFEDPAALKIADIGAADGDLGFFLESLGFEVDLVDGGGDDIRELRLLPPRLLKQALDSHVEIYGVDLDHDFVLPKTYDLVFFLGVLYHLRNPMLALDILARSTRYCVLSTKVADRVPARGKLGRRSSIDVTHVPVAYLLDAFEVNPNDDTNYWVFSEASLRRAVTRCGWDVLAYKTMGNPNAEPASPNEARAWCLLASRVFSGGR